MFPIPWNFPFRKKNGDMSTIGAEIGGAGSELPPHGVGDAGKLLGVKPNGSLEWSDNVNSEIQTLTNEASAIVNKLGAKNVMPVTMEVIKKCNTAGTWNDNVYTYRGITYTIYTDVSGNVTKINANGTSNEASAHLFFADGYKKPSQLGLELNVEYALNGCPDGGDTYGYSVCYDSGGAWSYPSDFGEATTFTFTSDSNTYRPMIKVRNSGTVINNKDFYPMLRLASIVNDEYAPYAMTNRELTDFATLADRLVSNSSLRIIPENTLPSELTNGVYRFDSGRTTGLWAGYGVIVLTLKNSTPNAVQLAFKIGAESDVSSNYVAYRLAYNDTWSNWAKLSGTNVT